MGHNVKETTSHASLPSEKLFKQRTYNVILPTLVLDIRKRPSTRSTFLHEN